MGLVIICQCYFHFPTFFNTIYIITFTFTCQFEPQFHFLSLSSARKPLKANSHSILCHWMKYWVLHILLDLDCIFKLKKTANLANKSKLWNLYDLVHTHERFNSKVESSSTYERQQTPTSGQILPHNPQLKPLKLYTILYLRCSYNFYIFHIFIAMSFFICFY